MSFLNLTADVTQIRLDKYLADEIEIVSRTKIKEFIKAEYVSVDGYPQKPSYLLQGGETIQIEIPEDRPKTLEGENIPLDIIYEDDELIILNKPAGLIVHPGAGNRAGTLVNGLIYHFDQLSQLYGNQRPGIVHRLDKNTSGILVVAKTDFAHIKLAQQFSDRTVKKSYRAIIWGTLQKKKGVINSPITRHPRNRSKFVVSETGRSATTFFSVLRDFCLLSLVELIPKTGRTHQIRVHMASIQHPVFADETYGGGKSKAKGYSPKERTFIYSIYSLINRQALHASSIAFNHPATGERVSFDVPISIDFLKVLKRLERNDNQS